MQKLKRYLWLSQINLFVWLIVCSFIASSVVFKNGGVSNYGNHYSTTPFFAIAFLGDSIYLYLASESLLILDRKFKHLARYLNILCVLLLSVFVTTFPRRFGVIFTDIHDNISIALFGYELLLAFWLLFKRPTRETVGYGLIMLIGTIIGFMSALHILGLMFVGQMVGELGFALLLVFVLPKVVAQELKKTTRK
ncbi:MAG: hypothetical protein JWO47_413 [Candidatus Saccharibacteria bacterium]|nr:hypothetical protein [Candidatus Saccharibacteria bacterium]